jgi:hypothetical protein
VVGAVPRGAIVGAVLVATGAAVPLHGQYFSFVGATSGPCSLVGAPRFIVNAVLLDDESVNTSRHFIGVPAVRDYRHLAASALVCLDTPESLIFGSCP